MNPTTSPVPRQMSRAGQNTGLVELNYDILLTIIQYCLPENEPVEIPPNPQSQHLTLCQICHLLRWLMLTSSRFWTRFSITSTSLGQHRDLLVEWLNRAGDPKNWFPISLENREESKFSMLELEEFVLPYSNRLCRLDIHLTYEALEGLFTLVPPSTFPHLSDFQVRCIHSDVQQSSILTPQRLFLGSPLEQFAVNLGPPVLVRGLGVSWGRLKVLHLTVTQARFFFPVSWVHAILDESRMSLETCSISLEPTTDPQLPRLLLPHLKDLSIHFRDSGWKTQASILGVLSLPSLDSLRLSCQEGLAFNEACPTLKSFFHRSPSLQHLRFERIPAPGTGFSTSINSFELVNILSLLSALRTVHLPKGHHTNLVAILEGILLKRVCPLMETLEIMVNNGLQVVRVIQALWRESAGVRSREGSLQRVRLIDPKLSWIGICEPSSVEDPDISHGRRIIEELKDEGLVILT